MKFFLISDNIDTLMGLRPVSYTHLDVYKRQRVHRITESTLKSLRAEQREMGFYAC